MEFWEIPNCRPCPLWRSFPPSNTTFFDYEAKYKEKASREICPARSPEPITRQAQEYALRAHKVLGLRGYSRTDMIVRGEEINPLGNQYHPGNDPDQPLPQAAQAAGLTFGALLDRLIELALEK